MPAPPMGITIGANETAKLSISVAPLEKLCPRRCRPSTRSRRSPARPLSGRSSTILRKTSFLVVLIVKGYLEEGQRIHVKSASTNFYQDVKGIRGMNAGARRVISGETGALPLTKRAQPGDEIYLVRKKGHAPLFLAPLGVATIVAGSAGIIAHVTDLTDVTQSVSSYRNSPNSSYRASLRRPFLSVRDSLCS